MIAAVDWFVWLMLDPIGLIVFFLAASAVSLAGSMFLFPFGRKIISVALIGFAFAAVWCGAIL